jgi:hypothetical protein
MEERLRAELETIAPAKIDEAAIYAKWASDQVADVPVVIDRVCELLSPKLTDGEKEQLLAMAARVAGPEAPPMYRQRAERLRRKLGLVFA